MLDKEIVFNPLVPPSTPRKAMPLHPTGPRPKQYIPNPPNWPNHPTPGRGEHPPHALGGAALII